MPAFKAYNLLYFRLFLATLRILNTPLIHPFQRLKRLVFLVFLLRQLDFISKYCIIGPKLIVYFLVFLFVFFLVFFLVAFLVFTVILLWSLLVSQFPQHHFVPQKGWSIKFMIFLNPVFILFIVVLFPSYLHTAVNSLVLVSVEVWPATSPASETLYYLRSFRIPSYIILSNS